MIDRKRGYPVGKHIPAKMRSLVRYCYLHGFASGPASRKAQFFRRAMAKTGLDLEIPELDEDDFEHLTLTRQLGVLTRLLAGEPACLIGSSMGGYLASLYAAAHPEVERLVLLAPALAFAALWESTTAPEKLAAWRDTGHMEVFHYATGTPRQVHYGLLEDARKYPPSPNVTLPALIFHGTNDDVVPISLSRTFAETHPNVKLIELASDHELTDVLDEISAWAIPFLAAAAETTKS